MDSTDDKVIFAIRLWERGTEKAVHIVDSRRPEKRKSLVLGAIRSENSATEPVKVYKAGESFFEPPGSRHLVSENASGTEPARLLAVFIADDLAQLTTFDK